MPFDHPAASKMGEDQIEAELFVVCGAGTFLRHVGVVEIADVDIKAHQAHLIVVIPGHRDDPRLHFVLLTQSDRAPRQLRAEIRFQSDPLKPLPQALVGMHASKSKAGHEEIVVVVFAGMVENNSRRKPFPARNQ